MRRIGLFFCATLFVSSVCVLECFGAYDVVIKSGRIYDGSGGPSYVADVAIQDDRIAAIGQLEADDDLIIDAQGLAVAPGFINMLSWATDNLIEDGRSQSDIRARA